MQYSITVPVEQEEAFDPILLPSIRVSPTVDVNCGYTWPPCLVTGFNYSRVPIHIMTFHSVELCTVNEWAFFPYMSQIYVQNVLQ